MEFGVHKMVQGGTKTGICTLVLGTVKWIVIRVR